MDRQVLRSGKFWMAAFAILMFMLAVIGGINSYSPIPHMDMWDGALDFYMRLMRGENNLWFAQHNEHRILLSRFLFWAEYEIFEGLNYFLIAVNYLLVLLAIFLFWRFSQLQHYQSIDQLSPKSPTPVLFFTLLITAWLSHWMQWENLSWGFQSQFFLAQSIPLAAFYCLAASSLNRRSLLYFLATAILGLLSLGTMANGVLALPLLTLTALIIRIGWIRTGLLAVCSVVGVMLYFWEYHTPGYHGSIIDTLQQQPFQLLRYVALYLGSPFFALVGEGQPGLVAAEISGFTLIILSAIRLGIEVKQRRLNPVTLALLGYLLYLGGTAVGTGTGRVIFGIAQAISSRYTTPALMAWASLLLLYWPMLSIFANKHRHGAATTLILFCSLLLWHQFSALQRPHHNLFDRQIGALALELGVADAQQIDHVYPMNAGLIDIANQATAKDLTVFGHYPLQGLREKWTDRFTPPADSPTCQGALDSVSTIEGEPDALRISGWVFNPVEESVPSRVIATDRLGRIVGFALTGQPRPDVADAVHESAGLSGYRGYIQHLEQGTEITLHGEGSQCSFAITVE